MIRKLTKLSVVTMIGLVAFVAGCPFTTPPVDLCADVDCDAGFTCDADTGDCVEDTPTDPQEFLDADATRGGTMYDKWWVVAEVDAPTDDHPRYPADGATAGGGSTTWRCKECHGWDYKGAAGVYGDPDGSHYTGIAGIFGTTLSAQEAFDEIKTDHGFGDAGLSDADIWDLAKFVLEGLIDTDDILDGDAFTGSVDAGQVLYDATCAACHGSDGLTPPPGHPEFDEYPGLLADENPWEVQHKVRFGQPGTAMPAQAGILSVEQVGDLGAYLQTLPASAEPQGFLDADVARGGAMYDKWWVVAEVDAPIDDHPRWAMQDTNVRSGADTWRCKECHGWDYKGAAGAYGSGSHFTGFPGVFGTTLSAQEAFDKIKTDHGFGGAGLSDADIWDLAKFVLEGQIDTDDIIGPDGVFTGDTTNGQTLYDSGIGGSLACALCHGADGTQLVFGGDETLGALADGNPWEVQHKIRFGQPGDLMPASIDVDASNDDVADVGAYSQTLPTEAG